MDPTWLFRFVRYGLVGLWIAAGAPLLFNRFINSKGRSNGLNRPLLLII